LKLDGAICAIGTSQMELYGGCIAELTGVEVTSYHQRLLEYDYQHVSIYLSVYLSITECKGGYVIISR
jgi:hypothetical protein